MKISYNFDETDLRSAYIERCKLTHPDLKSKSDDEVDPNKEFAEIENAYKRLKTHLKLKQQINEIRDKSSSVEDEEENKIKHKVPQHRQYLDNEGIGYGTPTERQKQYQKYRLMRATNRVSDYELNKIKSSEELSEEKAVSLKDANLQREMKIKQGFDRLVEDLIQESIAKGDFNNLPGYGKPLKNKPEYPYLDSITFKLNEILINNGFVPEWVLLEKEIREEKNSIRNQLFSLKSQSKLENISFVRQLLSEKVTEVNKMIEKYNRIVPILRKQQILMNLDKEVNKMRQNDENSVNNTQNQSINS